MKVILNKDSENMGKIGDIIIVADGYARNFLIPRGMAMPFNPSNLKSVQTIIAQKRKKLEKIKNEAIDLAKRIEGEEFTIKVKVGEKDKMFGSITSQDIQNLLKEKGYEIDKKRVQLTEVIKTIGIHKVNIKLYHDVIAGLTLNVVKE